MGLLIYSGVGAQSRRLPYSYTERFPGMEEFNDVRCVRQGSDGFIWIATGTGLLRFDGQQTRKFQPEASRTGSIADRSVNYLEAAPGKLFIATNQGLSVLDHATGRFSNYQLSDSGLFPMQQRRSDQIVNRLLLDSRGVLWIGTRDHGLFRADTGSMRAITVEPANADIVPNPFGGRGVLSIAEAAGNDSIIYAGTTSGLLIHNRVTGQTTQRYFPHPNPKIQTDQNAFRRLLSHPNGKLYVGTWRAGLRIYDPVTHSYTPLPVSGTAAQNLISAPIQHILLVNDDKLLITTGNGSMLYNPAMQQAEDTWTNDLSYDRYYGADFIDDRGRIWYGTVYGLQLFDPLMQQFETFSYQGLNPLGHGYSYFAVEEPSPGNITLFARNVDAVYHLNSRTGQWSRTPFPLAGMPRPELGWEARGVSRSPDGSYTLSTDHGLYRYEPGTRKISKLRFDEGLRLSRHGPVAWDATGALWLCSAAEGLFRWPKGSGKPQAMHQRWSALFPGDGPVFWNEVIPDRRGNVWLRHSMGYSVYLLAQDALVQGIAGRSGSDNRFFTEVRGMAEDRSGRMWMSGPDAEIGFVATDKPASGLSGRMRLQDSLGIQWLERLTLDSAGAIWGVSDRGLVRIDPDKRNVQLLGYEYGSRQTNFYQMTCLADGRLLLGGRNILTIVNPKQLHRNNELPQPYIAEVFTHPDRQPDKYAPVPNVLRLGYNTNAFAVRFSARGYSLPKGIRYRFRLQGLEDWNAAEDPQLISYSNLPGGDYTFEVEAINSEGMANPVSATMRVHVATAWWATWWFRILMGVLLASLIYGVYRYRIWQFRQNERLKSVFDKRLANMEMSTLLAQMNPHFLFNSLNSIDSYIIKNESAKASEYLNNFARLMRLILNNSQINKISLKDELETLELYLQMESLRFRGKFHYEIILAEDINTEAIEVPPMLIQPYVENAIWHGLMPMREQGNPKVIIELKLDNEQLEVIVEDNGIGRARAGEMARKRSPNGRKSSGMRITRDRIELINKLHNIETSVEITDLMHPGGQPAGTRVDIHIPV